MSLGPQRWLRKAFAEKSLQEAHGLRRFLKAKDAEEAQATRTQLEALNRQSREELEEVTAELQNAKSDLEEEQKLMKELFQKAS